MVFAGFSADGLAQRINDANSTHVITANQGVRGGKIVHLKKIVDEALRNCPQVQKVCCFFLLFLRVVHSHTRAQ